MDKRSRNPIFGKGYRSQFASFAGVDLHKTTVTLWAVDPDQGSLSRLTTSTKCIEKLETWIEAIPKPCWMAVEAVGFVEWFIDRFRRHSLTPNRSAQAAPKGWDDPESRFSLIGNHGKIPLPSGRSQANGPVRLCCRTVYAIMTITKPHVLRLAAALSPAPDLHVT